jgi:hypothetical protein
VEYRTVGRRQQGMLMHPAILKIIAAEAVRKQSPRGR